MRKTTIALVIAALVPQQTEPRCLRYQLSYPKPKLRKDRFCKHGKLAK